MTKIRYTHNPEKVYNGKRKINSFGHMSDDTTGDEKYMLHGLGKTLNSSVKIYNLDKLFTYKTKTSTTRVKVLTL